MAWTWGGRNWPLIRRIAAFGRKTPTTVRRGAEAGPQSTMADFGDFDPDFLPIHAACHAATMTSPERMYALYKAVRHIAETGAQGDFAECGVWRGGSVMVMAATLLACGVTDRKIYLFDTFEGMTPPTEHDRDISGAPAEQLLTRETRDPASQIWCYAPLDEVAQNLRPIGYPMNLFRFVKGPVETTIPKTLPGPLALLRLDTDWYESTRHELEHLYPLLVAGGVLIIDDYGHWRGSRRAVDEYFADGTMRPLLHRVDYTGRIGMKI